MSNDDDGIYKVDTVPPPDGEGDAYSAPTRVGPMAGAFVEELLAQSKRAEELEAKARSEKTTPPPPAPSPPSSDEPVDPAKLINVESLTAQLDAAEKERRESDAPSSSPPESAPAASAPVSSVAPVPAPSAMTTARKTGSPPQTNSLLIVAVLVVLAALGLYLLRR